MKNKDKKKESKNNIIEKKIKTMEKGKEYFKNVNNKENK